MSNKTKLTEKFNKEQEADSNRYKTAGSAMSVEEKLKVLESRGQGELIDIFNGWKPRASTRRRKGAPLDQRVSIALSPIERASLDGEIRAIKETGQSITLGGLIRSRAMGTPNIAEWKTIAWDALDELDSLIANQKELKDRRDMISLAFEQEDNADDPEELGLLEQEHMEIVRKLDKLTAKPGPKRSLRLQGRMTYAEAEAVKWRAMRLCLTTTDYLRMLIFDLEPNGPADQHLSLDARRRFYVSVIEVANSGFGNPPGVHQCSQCESYGDEISNLRERIRQMEAFGK